MWTRPLFFASSLFPNSSFSDAAQKLVDQVNSPSKMRLFFLSKLPSLWWWGVRVRQFSPQACQTSIPYSWRTQNPFQSTYFAAQAGAAELSTGLLAMLAIRSQSSAGSAPVSMLITGMQAQFVKKAVSTVTFSCTDGQLIADAVALAISTGLPQLVTTTSQGVQASGELVSSFQFTWSFKAK